MALEKNPDLAGAEQRLTAARALIGQAEAAFYPQLRVSETYAASDNPVQAFMMTLNQRAFTFNANFNNPPTTDNFNTKLLATYSLYNGGSTQARRDAAQLGAQAMARSLDAARNELVFEVTRAFYTVSKARRFVGTAEVALANMESNVRLAKSRFDQGATLKTDVLDSEVRLAEARENLIRANNALALSETVFRNVLGVGEAETVTAGTANEPTPIETSVASLDISGRPELLAAQKAVTAAEKQVRAVQAGRRPRVNAFASYDIDTGNLSRFEDSWVAGVSVEWDVFDGFLTLGKVNEAEAYVAAARAQLRKVELALQLEAKQADLNLREAISRLATTERVEAQAAESLQITKERYQNGLALLTQVLDAETALTAARQRRAVAETDRLIARAALDKALGKIWKE